MEFYAHPPVRKVWTLLTVGLLFMVPGWGQFMPQKLPEAAHAYTKWAALDGHLFALERHGAEPVEYLVRLTHDGSSQWTITSRLSLDESTVFAEAHFYDLRAHGNRLLITGYSNSRESMKSIGLGLVSLVPGGDLALEQIDLEALFLEAGLDRDLVVVKAVRLLKAGIVIHFDEIRSWMYPEQNSYNHFAWLPLNGTATPGLRVSGQVPGLPSSTGSLTCILEPAEASPAMVVNIGNTFHIVRWGPESWIHEAALPYPRSFITLNDICQPDSTGTGFLAARWNRVSDQFPGYQYTLGQDGWVTAEPVDPSPLEGRPIALSDGLLALSYMEIGLLKHGENGWAPFGLPVAKPVEYGSGRWVGSDQFLHMIRIEETAEAFTWFLPTLRPLTSPWFPDLPMEDGFQFIPWFGWLAIQPAMTANGVWAWHYGSGWIWLRGRDTEALQVWDPWLGDLYYTSLAFSAEAGGGFIWSYLANEYIYLTSIGDSDRWYYAPSRGEWFAVVSAPRQLPAELIQAAMEEDFPQLTILPDGRLDLRETAWVDGQAVTLIAVGDSSYRSDPVHPSEAHLTLRFSQINVYVRGHWVAALPLDQLWAEERIEFPQTIEARLTFRNGLSGRFSFHAEFNSGRTEGPFSGDF